MPEIRLSAAEGKKYFEDFMARFLEENADLIRRNRENGQGRETENPVSINSGEDSGSDDKTGVTKS